MPTIMEDIAQATSDAQEGINGILDKINQTFTITHITGKAPIADFDEDYGNVDLQSGDSSDENTTETWTVKGFYQPSNLASREQRKLRAAVGVIEEDIATIFIKNKDTNGNTIVRYPVSAGATEKQITEDDQVTDSRGQIYTIQQAEEWKALNLHYFVLKVRVAADRIN